MAETSDTAETPSIASRLPTELWLLVFERDDVLTYRDLKRLSRVDKRFHEIEKSHSLDDALFRSPPPAKPVEKGDPVRFHPVLNEASLVCTGVEDAHVYIRGKKDDDDSSPFVSVGDFPCVNEFATSPACKVVAVAMGGKPVARNASGVTVLDVVKASAAMWKSKPDTDHLLSISDWLLEGDPELDMREVTWRDTLGDHCFWEGMDKARCVKTGVVVLTPQWFGS
ncbi:hypothetical protein JCM6882_003096 [Rhodosporidiobolus microsporus]